MTATVQGCAHNAFDGEAVPGEAGFFEVGDNLPGRQLPTGTYTVAAAGS